MPGPIVVGPFERLKPDAEKSTSPVFEGERDWQRSPTIRHLHLYLPQPEKTSPVRGLQYSMGEPTRDIF